MDHLDNGTATPGDREPYDVIGVGFGPASLALATSIDDHAEDHPEEPPMRALFLERASSSAWQPNLLLPGADIQHHYLRDLATPRNPRSRFTFPRYLVETGQFYAFTLMGNFVTREHWSDYLEWAAGEVRSPALYHREVAEIAPVREGDTVAAARVTSRDPRTGEQDTHLARAVMVAPGYEPHVPETFQSQLGPRVFHAAELLPRLDALPQTLDSVAVVGAGQTAGETLLYLRERYPEAHLHALTRNAGFRMYELGHFSNEAFFPTESDYFYGLTPEQRERELAGVHATNYAAVDPDVSTALYRAAFADRLSGHHRLHVHKRTAVTGCTTASPGHRLELTEVNTDARDTLDVSAVVLCTGFREPRVASMLAPFAAHMRTGRDGELAVTRDFRIEVTDDCRVPLYLNGVTEQRHGIGTAASFSQIAVKADAVHADLRHRLVRTAAPQPA